jgi:hypothetical protein
MSVPSLESSIRTCQVDTAWAERAQSDRFLSTMALSCPMRPAMDITGRPACPDSLVTKTAGCNSPLDRVVVESALRPNYSEYVTLNPQGIQGGMYGSCGTKMAAANANHQMRNIGNGCGGTAPTGFGIGYNSQVIPSCGMQPQMAYEAAARRGRQAAGAYATSGVNQNFAGGF